MKFKHGILFGLLLGVLLFSAFSVGKVSATTGCFADVIGNPFETFICWMKDNGITSGTTPTTYSPYDYVTRGQMSVFMQRVANIPPWTGDIYINQGLTGLQPNGNYVGTAYVRYYTDFVKLASTTATTNYYQLSASLPASLYGRETFVKGVEVCYDASRTSGRIVKLDMQHWVHGQTLPAVEISDTTLRGDASCIVYTLTTSMSLWGSDHVVFLIGASFTSASDYVFLDSVNFILTPSSYSGVLAPVPAQEPSRPVDPNIKPDPATTSEGIAQ